MGQKPHDMKQHRFGIGPCADLTRGFEPLSDEGNGAFAPGFADFEAGPSKTGSVPDWPSDVLADDRHGKHGVKPLSIDVGDVVDGPVGSGLIRPVHHNRAG